VGKGSGYGDFMSYFQRIELTHLLMGINALVMQQTNCKARQDAGSMKPRNRRHSFRPIVQIGIDTV